MMISGCFDVSSGSYSFGGLNYFDMVDDVKDGDPGASW